MATPATVTDAIDTNARGPKKVSREGSTVEYHSLMDQIAVEEHQDRKTATSGAAGKAHRGLLFTRLIPPGAAS